MDTSAIAAQTRLKATGTSVEYQIFGRYFNGEWELIDVAETRRDRDYLLGEYQLSFGVGWSWKVKTARI